MRKGQGEAYGDGAAYVIDSRQQYQFTGTNLREYQYVAAPRLDEFDNWGSERDRRYDSSVSARYVSQDVVGYQDLDANGTWRTDASYGNVWYPNRVSAGWAPYRDGHWAWIDPWGWTWMDDAPWGYAVSHYGRWANLQGNWGWVPGPMRTRAYYAPALVAFVGGNNFQVAISSGNVGGTAWFPLGPREVYRPSYASSRAYIENINRSNTVVTTTVINNTYNNNVTNIVYANRQVAGAVIAVPTSAFMQSQPVSKTAVRVSRDMNIGGPVAFVARVAPTEKSVRGAAIQVGKPPGGAFQRPVVARTQPAAAHSGFEAQQQQLAAKPGAPLNDNERKQLRPAPTVLTPAVKVVTPAQIAPPTAPPPRIAPTLRTPEATPKAVQPVPPRQQPEQSARPEQRSRGEQRVQQMAPPPAPVQRVVPAAPQPVAPSSPSAQQQEQRPRPEQRGRIEQRQQPAAPTQSPPAVDPQAAPVAPAATQVPRQRARPEPVPAQQADTRPPVAAPKPAAQPQVAPEQTRRGQEPKPAADKSAEKKRDKDKAENQRDGETGK
jgi:hypothetical protein